MSRGNTAYIRKSTKKEGHLYDLCRFRIESNGRVSIREGRGWRGLSLEASRYILRSLYDRRPKPIDDVFECKLAAEIALEKTCRRAKCRRPIAKSRLLNGLRVGSPSIYCSHVCQAREAQRTFAQRLRRAAATKAKHEA